MSELGRLYRNCQHNEHDHFEQGAVKVEAKFELDVLLSSLLISLISLFSCPGGRLGQI